jgi:hypothetical protein
LTAVLRADFGKTAEIVRESRLFARLVQLRERDCPCHAGAESASSSRPFAFNAVIAGQRFIIAVSLSAIAVMRFVIQNDEVSFVPKFPANPPDHLIRVEFRSSYSAFGV